MSLYEKAEERYNNDEDNYTKAIKSFSKQATKVINSGDPIIQKSLHNYNKAVTVREKKIGRQIPVQATAKSKRT